MSAHGGHQTPRERSPTAQDGKEQSHKNQLAESNGDGSSGDGAKRDLAAEETGSPQGYLHFVEQLAKVWKDQPDVLVSWKDLAYTLSIDQQETAVHNIFTTFLNALKAPINGWTGHHRYNLSALQPSSGMILPASTTLVLAPPGHGKSLFLKALSGRLAHDSRLKGQVLFNHRTASENRKMDVYTNRLCAYIDSASSNFPILTVRETFEFACQNALPAPDLLKPNQQAANGPHHNQQRRHDDAEAPNEEQEAALVEELIKDDAKRVDLMIDLLGLRECADVIIGNELLRGISGGQRQRVRIGEMLLSNARLLCMDEVTTGLDSSVSLHIFAALKAVCRMNRMSVVAALLQPTPELYSTFDDIILLRHGTILFHGRRTDIPRWLKKVAGVELPVGTDEAGFLVAFLTDPRLAVKELQAQQKEDEMKTKNHEQRELSSFRAESTSEFISGDQQQQLRDADGQRDAGDSSPVAVDPSVVRFHFLNDDAVEVGVQDVGRGLKATHSGSPLSHGSEYEKVEGEWSPRQQVFEGEDEKRLKGSREVSATAVVGESNQGAHAVPRTEHAERTSLLASTFISARGILASPPVRGGMKQQWPGSLVRLNRAVSFQEDENRTRGFEKSLRNPRLSSHRSKSMSDTSEPVFTTIQLRERYEQSEWAQLMNIELDLAKQHFPPLDPTNWSTYSRKQFCEAYPHTPLRHGWYNVKRQWKLVTRNKALAPPRLFQCVLIGIILGTLFMNLGLDQYSARFGLLLYVLMFGAFSNLSEVPLADEARDVVSRQIDSGFYPASSYAVSVAIMHVPLTLLEAAVYCNFIYWLPAFDPDAGRFFFFLLVFIINSNAFSVLFRSVSYMASNPDVARQMDLPFIIVCVIFSGFLINFHEIPIWLKWVFWCTPLSWGLRALALNEFNSPRYDALTADGSTRLGDSYIEQFGLQADSIFKWTGVAFLAGIYILGLLSNCLLLGVLPPRQHIGTRLTEKDRRLAASSSSAGQAGSSGANVTGSFQGGREFGSGAGSGVQEPSQSNPKTDEVVLQMEQEHDDDTSSSDEDEQQPSQLQQQQQQQQFSSQQQPHSAANGSAPQKAMGTKRLGSHKKSSASLASFAFQRVSLAWQDLDYSVPVAGGGSKKLLRGVSGYARPGTMTALMGSSGAGKTTLMDVIAGRKTIGTIEGKIMVNGKAKDVRMFQRLSGYCEQEDIHVGTSTVREALRFSALMRLPTTVKQDKRERFVEDVMGLVGLSKLANRLIGDESINGLSAGELKLVTIAVELVANPSLIFLDEPTSGLDAPSARRVMKAVKRIASTGRTVICTIHQPSEEVFLLFDNLLLLQPGGVVVYNGPLGRRGHTLVKFFEKVSGESLGRVHQGAKRGQVDQALQDAKNQSADGDRGASGPTKSGMRHHKQSGRSVRVNPANWMLTLLGSSDVDYAKAWKESKMAKEADAITDETAKDEARSDDSRTSQNQAGEVNLEADSSVKNHRRHLQQTHDTRQWHPSQVAAVNSGARKQGAPNASASGHDGDPHGQVSTDDSAYLSSGKRYWAVQHRLFVSHWRNGPMNLTRLMLMVIISIFLGLVYLKLAPPTNFGQTISINGVIFLSLIFAANVTAAGPLPTLFRQRAVFYRETTAGLYSSLTFQLSVFVVELPWLLLCSALFLLPLYWMVAFPADAAVFFKYYLAISLMFLFYSSLLTLWLAALPSQIVANIASGLLNSLFFVFGGLLLPPSQIPSGWKWFYYIDPIPKAFNPVVLSLQECDLSTPEAASACPQLSLGPNQPSQPIYAFLRQSLDASPDDFGRDMGWLILEIAVLRIFILLAFRFISHIKR